MIIRCYGARGSIPVSGPAYTQYGGDTTCIEIRTRNDDIIVVDAGSGIRRLGNRLVEEGRFDVHLLFTHSHWDHILGFPFFKPLYDERARIRLIGCPLAQGDIHKLLAKSMSPPFFPLRFPELNSTIDYTPECQESFRIDSVEISAIRLSHPNMGSGYKFVEDGKAFVFLTDNELGYVHRGGRTLNEYAAFARAADILMHDAEYSTDQYRETISWGHSTYRDALELAQLAGVRQLGLFHHNQDRTDDEIDAIVAECRDVLDRNGSRMACFAVTQETELIL